MKHIFRISSGLIGLAILHMLRPDHYSGWPALAFVGGWLACYAAFGKDAP